MTTPIPVKVHFDLLITESNDDNTFGVENALDDPTVYSKSTHGKQSPDLQPAVLKHNPGTSSAVGKEQSILQPPTLSDLPTPSNGVPTKDDATLFQPTISSEQLPENTSNNITQSFATGNKEIILSVKIPNNDDNNHNEKPLTKTPRDIMLKNRKERINAKKQQDEFEEKHKQLQQLQKIKDDFKTIDAETEQPKVDNPKPRNKRLAEKKDKQNALNQVLLSNDNGEPKIVDTIYQKTGDTSSPLIEKSDSKTNVSGRIGEKPDEKSKLETVIVRTTERARVGVPALSEDGLPSNANENAANPYSLILPGVEGNVQLPELPIETPLSTIQHISLTGTVYFYVNQETKTPLLMSGEINHNFDVNYTQTLCEGNLTLQLNHTINETKIMANTAPFGATVKINGNLCIHKNIYNITNNTSNIIIKNITHIPPLENTAATFTLGENDKPFVRKYFEYSGKIYVDDWSSKIHWRTLYNPHNYMVSSHESDTKTKDRFGAFNLGDLALYKRKINMYIEEVSLMGGNVRISPLSFVIDMQKTSVSGGSPSTSGGTLSQTPLLTNSPEQKWKLAKLANDGNTKTSSAKVHPAPDSTNPANKPRRNSFNDNLHNVVPPVIPQRSATTTTTTPTLKNPAIPVSGQSLNPQNKNVKIDNNNSVSEPEFAKIQNDIIDGQNLLTKLIESKVRNTNETIAEFNSRIIQKFIEHIESTNVPNESLTVGSFFHTANTHINDAVIINILTDLLAAEKNESEKNKIRDTIQHSKIPQYIKSLISKDNTRALSDLSNIKRDQIKSNDNRLHTDDAHISSKYKLREPAKPINQDEDLKIQISGNLNTLSGVGIIHHTFELRYTNRKEHDPITYEVTKIIKDNDKTTFSNLSRRSLSQNTDITKTFYIKGKIDIGSNEKGLFGQFAILFDTNIQMDLSFIERKSANTNLQPSFEVHHIHIYNGRRSRNKDERPIAIGHIKNKINLDKTNQNGDTNIVYDCKSNININLRLPTLKNASASFDDADIDSIPKNTRKKKPGGGRSRTRRYKRKGL